MSYPTTSKRANQDSDDGESKRFRSDFGGPIKHYIMDKADWQLTINQILSLFKRCRLVVLDSAPDKNNNVNPHYHIVAEAKMSQRQIRDASLATLRSAEIKGGLETKGMYLTARIKGIESAVHYNRLIAYLKRKDENGILHEDESVTYGGANNFVWRALDEAEEPQRFNDEEMSEFRRRFPLINSWKKVAAQKKLSKRVVVELEEMEQQRKWEDNIRPLSDEEKHSLMPNLPVINHAFNLRNQLISHDQNSGVCMILCGGALMCKSTINRIIASSFGEYAIWPGSQWIQRDPLKFDTAARQGISTIVVEEMQWIDVQHRITLEKTINSIKEQLTGAGLDVRLAKTKSNVTDDIKFKMDHLLISMNENEYVNYRTLAAMINSKAEFRRRFILINMDDPKYEDIAICRNRPNNNWRGNETM